MERERFKPGPEAIEVEEIAMMGNGESENLQNHYSSNNNPSREDTTESSNSSSNTEDPRRIQEISFLEFLWSLIPIGLYLYDVWSDIILAHFYRVELWWTEFTFTTLFLVLPSVVTALFRFRGNQKHIEKISTISIILDIVASMVYLMPLLASLEYLWYSATTYFLRRRITCWEWPPKKFINNEKYADRVTWILSTLAIMRLIESFVEAFPQVTLQLYITLDQLHNPNGPFNGEVPWTVIQCTVSSVLSCSWSICSAYVAFSYGSPLIAKKKMPLFRLILMFIAYVFLICTRFFSLLYLLISFPLAFLIFCVIHWLCNLIWIYLENYFVPSTQPQTLGLVGVLGNCMRAFSFILVHSHIRPKRFHSTVWMTYSLLFIENFVINLACFLFGTHFGGFISNGILSVDAICLVVLPQLVFIFGFTLLVWQNHFELTMDAEDEIQYLERMAVVREIFFPILGITPENANSNQV